MDEHKKVYMSRDLSMMLRDKKGSNRINRIIRATLKELDRKSQREYPE